MWMPIMQVLAVLFVSFALATAQYRHRHPGFQNVHTPLATSASKERPYVSIPIVLMPDGQVVPKPSQASYKYLGNLPGHLSSIQQNQQQDSSRSRGTSMVDESGNNYQMVLPAPPNYTQHRGSSKSSKHHGHPRNSGSSPKQQRGQRNHPQMHHKNPMPQGYSPSPNQQVAVAHNQNVANFLTFATQLGADVLSQQRQIQQSSASPTTEITYTPAEVPKSQENYMLQGTQAQEQTNGNTYLQTHTHQGNVAHLFQNGNYQVHGRNLQQVQKPQHQDASQTTNQQYAQPNSRQPSQGMAVQNQQNNMQQNVGATVNFPNSQNGPVQANAYSQAPQYSVQQSYGQNSNQGQSQGMHLINAGNFNQHQQMKAPYTPQPVLEIASYDVNAHAVNPNYAIANQAGQSYAVIDPNGAQINYANTAQATPAMYQYQSQQSGGQVSQSNSNAEQGDQKGYIPYQNLQDSSSSNVNTPQGSYLQPPQQQSDSVHNAVPQPYAVVPNMQSVYVNQNAQMMLKQQTNAAPSSQLVSYTYTHEQPLQSTPGQQESKQETPVTPSNHYQNSAPASSHYQNSVAGTNNYQSSVQSTNNYQGSVQSSNNYQSSVPSTSNYQGSVPSTSNYQGSVPSTNNYQSSVPSTSNYQGSVPATSNYQDSVPSTSNYQGSVPSTSNYQGSIPATSNYQSSLPATNNYQIAQQKGSSKQESATTNGGGQLIYASTSSKQINYTPSDQSYASSQQQSNVSPVQSSQSYVSFPSSNTAYKQESPSSAKYESATSGLVTPGSTYVKMAQSGGSSGQASSSSDQNEDDHDYEDTEEEETSYKVVYIPLDILKNILTNNQVENNQRSDKQS